jgi:hypothetical protein
MANTDDLADAVDDRRNGHAREAVRLRADLEVGVIVPVGCLVPLTLVVALLVGAGVLFASRLGTSKRASERRVAGDRHGAAGGPAVLSTQVVPLR